MCSYNDSGLLLALMPSLRPYLNVNCFVWLVSSPSNGAGDGDATVDYFVRTCKFTKLIIAVIYKHS